MTKKTISFIRKFPDADVKYLRSVLDEHYNFIFPSDYSQDSLLNHISKVQVLIGRAIFPELIKAAKNLEIVHSPGAGIDGINLEILKGTKIKLCNSHSNSKYVAEFSIGLLFSLLKKISLHDRLMRTGKWFRPTGQPSDLLYTSDSLFGKTIGFLGYGKIAQDIHQLLTPFGNRVIACKKNKSDNIPNVVLLTLKEVLSEADIVFITMPLTSDTREIINIENLKLMKSSSWLINVSRGPIIKESDLYTALDKNIIAGAAIDVWTQIHTDGELKFPSKDYPFHLLDNVIMSPYRAGYVKGFSPHLIGVAENLLKYAKSNELENVINLYTGY